MEDAFAKLAISTVSFVGKAAFGMASRAALVSLHTVCTLPATITACDCSMANQHTCLPC